MVPKPTDTERFLGDAGVDMVPMLVLMATTPTCTAEIDFVATKLALHVGAADMHVV